MSFSANSDGESVRGDYRSRDHQQIQSKTHSNQNEWSLQVVMVNCKMSCEMSLSFHILVHFAERKICTNIQYVNLGESAGLMLYVINISVCVFHQVIWEKMNSAYIHLLWSSLWFIIPNVVSFCMNTIYFPSCPSVQSWSLRAPLTTSPSCWTPLTTASFAWTRTTTACMWAAKTTFCPWICTTSTRSRS